jgi:alkylation response protein AidB-like acyl-CoA dehydrogenase
MRLSCLCGVVLAGLAVPAVGQTLAPVDAPSLPSVRLPTPEVDEDAPPSAFLNAARLAIAAGRDGEALEALERAESRALDRSVRPSRAGVPSPQPLVAAIAQARAALAGGDRMQTLQLIDQALAIMAARQP